MNNCSFGLSSSDQDPISGIGMCVGLEKLSWDKHQHPCQQIFTCCFFRPRYDGKSPLTHQIARWQHHQGTKKNPLSKDMDQPSVLSVLLLVSRSRTRFNKLDTPITSRTGFETCRLCRDPPVGSWAGFSIALSLNSPRSSEWVM